MINSPIWRIIFAATVVSVNAAPGHAAATSPTGAIHAPRAVVAQLKTQSQPPAATKVEGLTAPADVWKKVLDKIKRDGVKGADSDFFMQTLTGSYGEPKRDYAVHSITIKYFVDTDGDIKIAGVELNLERSILTLASGTIRTDYWSLLAKPTGELGLAIYKQRVDVPGADLIPGTSAVVDLADPRVKECFGEMLKFWSAR